jgi:FMN phosphatase YigB (HAD superfamily)
MNKTLLLDIDGVLLRDKNLQGHVKNNCVRYVKEKIPACKNPEEMNKWLYLSHGHTGVGLSKVYGVDMSDFNEHVYDKHLMEHLSEIVHGTEFQLEAKEIHSLTYHGWKIGLFTNTPIQWARPVAHAISDEIFISCSGPYSEYLKPNPLAYEFFPKNRNYLYVDDSLKNLGATRTMEGWHPYYFSQSDVVEWCPTVKSISELCQIARLFDCE